MKKLIPEAIALLICAVVFAIIALIPIAISDGGLLCSFMESHGFFYMSEPSAHYSQIAVYLSNGSLFDLRILGGIYAVLATVAILLIVHFGKRGNWTDYFLAVLTPLIFTDFAWTVYFNTLFPLAPALIIFLFAISSLLWAKGKGKFSWVAPICLFILFVVFCAGSNFKIMEQVVPWNPEYPSLMFHTRPNFLSNFTFDTSTQSISHAIGWNLYSALKVNILSGTAFMFAKLVPNSWFMPFNMIFDAAILALIIGSTRAIRKRNLETREKFGVTQ